MSGAFVPASVAIGLISLTSGMAIKIWTEILYNLSRMGSFGKLIFPHSLERKKNLEGVFFQCYLFLFGNLCVTRASYLPPVWIGQWALGG